MRTAPAAALLALGGIGLLLLPVTALSATYDLPGDDLPDAWGCTQDSNTVTCNDLVKLAGNDEINVNESTDWILNDGLETNDGDQINAGGGPSDLSIEVDGDVTMKGGGELVADVETVTGSDGTITTKDGDTLEGDFTTDKSMDLGQNSILSGAVSVGEDLNLKDDAEIDGDVKVLRDVDLKDGAEITGNIDADRDVTSRGDIGGDIDAGGLVSIESGKDDDKNVVGGDIIADDDVILKTDTLVDGDVISKQDVELKTDAEVTGCVSAGGELKNDGNIGCASDLTLLASETQVQVGDAVTLGVAAQNCDTGDSDDAETWRDTWEDTDEIGLKTEGTGEVVEESVCDRSPQQTVTADESGKFRITFRSEFCDENPGQCKQNKFSENVKTFGSDSVTITVGEPADPPAEGSLVAEYRMEELAWEGTTGEVSDASGTGNDGTAQNGANTGVETPDPAIPGDPGTCRYGEFDGDDDFVRVPHDDSLEMSDNDAVTVSAWVRQTRDQSDQSWVAVAQKSDTSYNLQLQGGDEPTFTIHDGGWESVSSGVTLEQDRWYHVAGTYDGNDVRIYVDGQLEATGTAGGQMTDASDFDVGIGENLDQTGRHFAGQIDEVRIYQQALSESDVGEIANATHPCTSLLTEYRMDEANWDGTAGEVTDQTGNGHDATARNGASTDNADPAIAGNPGTCGYGELDGGDQFVEDDDAGDYLNGLEAITVTTWLYNAAGLGNDNGIFATTSTSNQDNNLGMRYDASGASTGNSNLVKASINTDACSDNADCLQVETESGVQVDGAWQHVAMTWESGDKIRIYINGEEVDTTVTGSGIGVHEGEIDSVDFLRIGKSELANDDWEGRVDEFRVYGGALTGAEIDRVFDDTHPCPATGLDHYAVDHDRTAVSCAAEPITITAHDSDDNPVDAGNASIDLSTSTDEGTWSAVTAGSGTLDDASEGDGAGRYTFPDNGESSVTLAFNYTTVERGSPETVNFDVVDGDGVTEDGDEDPDLTVSHSGFRITDGSGNPIDVADQIAAKPSNTAPGDQILGLQAIRTSDDDPSECEPAFSEDTTVEVGLAGECKDPATCAGRELAVTNDGTTTSVDTSDDNGGAGTASYEPVELLFEDNAEARMVLAYPDAGAIQFHARFDPIDESGDAPTEEPITGSSNDFVVRPFGFDVVVPDDPDSSGPSGETLASAGDEFSVRVRAVAWDGGDGFDDDQPADSADLSDNDTTPNFGNEEFPPVAELSPSLSAPNPADPDTRDGSLSNATYDDFGADGPGEQLREDITWNEVGYVNLEAELDGDYLGSQTITGRAENVGRFAPKRLMVQLDNDPLFRDATGMWSSPFTYMGQAFTYDSASGEPQITVTALNADGGITENYGGEGEGGDDFWKLETPQREYEDATGDVATEFSPDLDPGSIDWTDGSGADTRSDYDGKGTFTVRGDEFSYDRLVAANRQDLEFEDPFPAKVDLTFAADEFDDGDACYDPDENGTCEPFDVSEIDGTELRYGRLVVDNALGSELGDLPLEARIEYWDDGTWNVNNKDGSTELDLATDVDLTNETGALSDISTVDGTDDIDLADAENGGETNLTTETADPLEFEDGTAAFTFKAPGAQKVGWAAVVPRLATNHPYLQFAWSTDGDPEDGDLSDDPRARATFGLFPGNANQIYREEVLR